MRNLLFIGLGAFFLAAAASFAPDKKMQQHKLPPGTTQITDSLYRDSLFIDEYEVSNLAWREFLMYLQQNPTDTLKYEDMLPDTTVWDKIDQQYTVYYLRHPDFRDFPVVGITYEQAVAFCKWRTERVNELYLAHPEANPYPESNYIYRLPTIKEWELMAGGGRPVDSFPYSQDSIYIKYKKRWEKAFNCFYGSRTDLYSTERTTMAPVESYFPNAYGVYNYIGNAAEMVAEKGIAKGGGFDSELKYCTIKDEEHYTKPAPFLGFRCICEIVLPTEELRNRRRQAKEIADLKERANNRKKGRKVEFDTTGQGPVDSTFQSPNNKPVKEKKKGRKKGHSIEIDSSEFETPEVDSIKKDGAFYWKKNERESSHPPQQALRKFVPFKEEELG